MIRVGYQKSTYFLFFYNKQINKTPLSLILKSFISILNKSNQNASVFRLSIVCYDSYKYKRFQ